MKVTKNPPKTKEIEVAPATVTLELTIEEGEALAALSGKFSAFDEMPLRGLYHRFDAAGVSVHKYHVNISEYGVISLRKK